MMYRSLSSDTLIGNAPSIVGIPIDPLSTIYWLLLFIISGRSENLEQFKCEDKNSTSGNLRACSSIAVAQFGRDVELPLASL